MKVKCLITKKELDGQETRYRNGWINIKNLELREAFAFHKDNKTVSITDVRPTFQATRSGYIHDAIL
jgi:hypothetical protein